PPDMAALAPRAEPPHGRSDAAPRASAAARIRKASVPRDPGSRPRAFARSGMLAAARRKVRPHPPALRRWHRTRRKASAAAPGKNRAFRAGGFSALFGTVSSRWARMNKAPPGAALIQRAVVAP